MAKNLKLTIKNTQIAEAVKLGALKSKLAKKAPAKAEAADKDKNGGGDEPVAKSHAAKAVKAGHEEPKEKEAEAPPRIRARSKSSFAEPAVQGTPPVAQPVEQEAEVEVTPTFKEEVVTSEIFPEAVVRTKTSAEIRKEIFGDDTPVVEAPAPVPTPVAEPTPVAPPAPVPPPKAKAPEFVTPIVKERTAYVHPAPAVPYEKLGPTGRHIRDLLPKTPAPAPKPATQEVKEAGGHEKARVKPKAGEPAASIENVEEESAKKGPAGAKGPKFKEFRDIKPTKRTEPSGKFDARDRQGLRGGEDEQWRRRRAKQTRYAQEDVTIRPTSLKLRLPISIKDLASEMKLKASQLISKLFLQGVVATLNDLLQDETTVQLLGHEFGCEITIDTSEEKRIRVTDQTIKEELQHAPPELLTKRPPVVAFMGHVDHGKTSLIDAIRKSNRAAGEAGAITQHIGAFRCQTSVGDIAILDTPGHEAFSAMRARGADVTDIVVLVVAGDEGLRQQSIEAMQHAKDAKVTIVVAINKSDKPNFNADNVYRQLAENDLLPEVWGGQTITVNCSATTGEGIQPLLEMLALQADVLELKANPQSRARGTVLESEMHKGMGSVATVLVQNGTLKRGDPLVFGRHWGRVKTMHDEYGRELQEAPPSTPVEITGLSGLPEAGEEFIVVKNEKEAQEIAQARHEGARQTNLQLQQQKKKLSVENLFQQASDAAGKSGKKILNLILRADVQGSLEALKAALLKFESTKAEVNIIFAGVGEISESDVQLAAASKAVIIGFHTQVESHAEAFIKQLGVQLRLHDIIYHAVDDVKLLMAGLLEKLAREDEKGKAIVKATFKSSQTGIIAGCQVTEGTIYRNNQARLKRGNEVIWKGSIGSLKRVKEDVREVQKGMECGILLNNWTDILEGDIIETYEVTYIAQEL